jgi:hypothetical protein
MARAALFEKIKQRFSSIKDKESRNSRFDTVSHNAVIVQTRQRLATFKSKSFFISDFGSVSARAIPESVLPFRIKFTNIGIESYGPNNPAPIGIAIIGFNNYIL